MSRAAVTTCMAAALPGANRVALEMAEEEPVRKPPSGARWQPSRWRLLTKISVVLALPVLVALVLAGLRVQAELSRAGGLSEVRDQMPVLQGSAELTGAP